jgi:hypothetical protein
METGMSRRDALPVGLGLSYAAFMAGILTWYSHSEGKPASHPVWTWAMVYALVIGCRAIPWTLIWWDGSRGVKILRSALAPACGAVVGASFVGLAPNAEAAVGSAPGGVFGLIFLLVWWALEVRGASHPPAIEKCAKCVHNPDHNLRECLWTNDWVPLLMAGGIWARHVCALETTGEDDRAVRTFRRGLVRHMDAEPSRHAIEAAATAATHTSHGDSARQRLLEHVAQHYRGTLVGDLARSALRSDGTKSADDSTVF